jgi:glyoxylase-like metal-dependent hydrolase (beta-lactamase superfamily II)
LKLTFFSTGYGNVPLGLFVRGGGWKKVRFPILCAVVEREDGLVLFDTGIGTRITQDFRPLAHRGNWFFSKAVMRTEFEPARDALVNQLQAVGFDPADVRYAVLSHLHWDHAGGMRDFPGARFIINRHEWDEAIARGVIDAGAYIKGQFEGAGLDVHLISTDSDKPYLSFPASYDIFDDGTMVLVDVPGHAPGQLGMVVNLPSGRRFFLTGDSFYFPDSLEQKAPKSRLMQALVKEGPESEETLERLWGLMKSEPNIEMVPCHDYRIPGRFELAPVSYE